jgi:hypothetical protein
MAEVSNAMKTSSSFGMLVLVAIILAGSLAHAQYAGRWKTTSDTPTGKPMFTVVIRESDAKIVGSMIQVLPDGGQREMEILDPVISNRTLTFQTKNHDEIFHWRLTLEKNRRWAKLHGVEGPTTAGQRSGELVFEFTVTNQI